MPEDPAADVLWSRRRKGDSNISKVFFSIFQALNRKAEMIETLPHAHIRMIGRPPDQKIDRAVGYAEGIFIAEIFPFLESKNLMIEFGHLFRFRSPDGDVIDLPWLLPTVVSVTLLNFRVFFP